MEIGEAINVGFRDNIVSLLLIIYAFSVPPPLSHIPPLFFIPQGSLVCPRALSLPLKTNFRQRYDKRSVKNTLVVAQWEPS